MTNIEAQSHDGRELELMLAGRKPLAVFSTGILSNETANSEFDVHVRDGRIVKHVREERWQKPQELGGKPVLGTRCTLFALKAERWRIPAYLLLRDATDNMPWNDTLEAVACRLLGYSKEETEAWIEYTKQRYGGWGAIPVLVALTEADVRKVKSLGYRALPTDYGGPNILVLQEEQPDFEELCPEFRGLSLRPARLALASKFALGLHVDTLHDVRIARFAPHLISQINQNLRRNVEILCTHPAGAAESAVDGEGSPDPAPRQLQVLALPVPRLTPSCFAETTSG